MFSRLTTYLLLFNIFAVHSIYAQIDDQITIQKPAQYKNKVLPAERSTGKFGFLKKTFSNTFTHFNYYFNANQKFNEALEQAYSAQVDDYSQWIAFYPYNLTASAQNTIVLDSVMHKATAGILLHDLRNNWVDDLFLLIGKSYFFKKQFDSAAIIFKYINYAFAPKDNSGYRKIIGSNQPSERNLFSVFNLSEKDLLHKIFSKPKARNEALLWLIRSYIECNRIEEAEALLQTLQNDAHFPSDLQPYFIEIKAYLFYKQQQFDSAANCLTKCIRSLYSGSIYARQLFLTAQLYEQASQFNTAISFYKKTAQQATDAALESYATLQALLLNAVYSTANVDSSIEELLRIAKRKKYTAYKSAIFYTLARIAYNKNKIPEAEQWLIESVKYGQINLTQKNKSFLLLGDIAFSNQQYALAANWYDSITTEMLTAAEAQKVNDRKPYLATIRAQESIIHREDSLQHLASLPEEERMRILKKAVKQLRKKQGLKEEEGNNDESINQNTAVASDLFTNPTNSNSNEAYFANTSLKAQGYGAFVRIWGKRANTDNWRRKAVIDKNTTTNDVDNSASISKHDVPDSEITVEGLLKNIPLTKTQMMASEQLIEQALVAIAETVQNGLEMYTFAIDTYLNCIQKFPTTSSLAAIYFNLIYCYNKLGNTAAVNHYKKLLLDKFSTSSWAEKLLHIPTSVPEKNNATATYDTIYNTFLEGRFEEALTAKKKMDSVYGTRFYTPQLLFIESIYYTKTRQDSNAIKHLELLAQQFASSPLSVKAKYMVEVIKRRASIEDYLTKLQISRVKEEDSVVVDRQDKIVKENNDIVIDEKSTYHISGIPFTISKPMLKPMPKRITTKSSILLKDSLLQKHTIPSYLLTSTKYNFKPNNKHAVMIVFEKVASLFIAEVRTAFNNYHQTELYNKALTTKLEPLDSTHTIVWVDTFENIGDAITYINKVKPITSSEIIPWLTNSKYIFLPIDVENWSILKVDKQLGLYKDFLHSLLPKQF